MPEYDVSPARSQVEISGKSSLHPINATFPAGALSGVIVAEILEGSIDVNASPKGRVELPVEALSFGNALYDRELPKRLSTRTYPLIVVELERVDEPTRTGEHRLGLRLLLHGVSRAFDERVTVEIPDDRSLTINGEHTFDVREFGIEPPKKLGMKVHPDFTVKVSLVAELATGA